VASRFIRPQNTDWRYAARTLPTLSEHCPELQVCTQQNVFADADANLKKFVAMARVRGMRFLPHAWQLMLEQDCPLFARDIARWNPEASWATPRVLEKQGIAAGDIDRILAKKLIFSSQVSLDDFARQNGESLRAKSIVIPFLITGLTPAQDINNKWNHQPLRFLFVGREANRKGLPATINALTPWLTENPESSLTIVSTMDDGPVEVPNLSNITLRGETSRADVLRLMAQSHFLLMPSSIENYGFVYLEAMSQGCVPLAIDRPVQRELIGEHGILVSSQQAEEIRTAMCQALADRNKSCGKALSGLQHYKRKHAPEVVAQQFSEAIRAA
jgi:glycosyltransferase involved in cell wall biosynthesis